MRKLWCALIAAGAMAVAVPVGVHAETSPPCSYGDARMWFETLPVRPPDSPPPCTFRLFFDKQTFTFTENDYFFGGVTLSADYSNDAERDARIAEQEAASVRVWIANATTRNAPLVEQSVERTPIRYAQPEAEGQKPIVWTQWGIIRQLPPGEYFVVTQASFDKKPWTVRLVITAAS